MKVPFIIYADMESLFENISIFHNNPNKLSTTKINKYTLSGYSLCTHGSFGNAKTRLDYYRSQDCMKMFCKDLKEHATKITNLEKKELIALHYKENKSYKNQKLC